MFSGVLWTCLYLLLCFCCYNFFFDVLIVNFLNRFNTLIYFYLLTVLYWVQKKLLRCSLKLRNTYRKTPVLGSLFNKVVGLQACNYIKKRVQHRCFLWNFRKFLRTSFLKNICERLLFLSRLLGWVKVKEIIEKSSQ